MRRIRAAVLRVCNLFYRMRQDRQLAEELESHLQMHVDDNLRRGMPAEEARRRALVKLGGVEVVKERCRERRGVPAIESLQQDVRYAARLLRKNPGFAVVTIVTLALGIGANTAIFSLLHAVLLKALPVTDPERLVTLARLDERDNSMPLSGTRFPYPLLEQLGTRNHVLSDLIPYQTYDLSLYAGTTAERVTGQLVSGNYFGALDVSAVVGRTLQPDDDRPHAARPVAVLGHGFWQRRFAGDPAIVGRTIRVNAYPVTVVGVAPRGFFGVELGRSPDLWMPLWAMNDLKLPGEMLENRDAWVWPTFARLAPGVTRAQAEARLNTLIRNILRTVGGHADSRRLVLLPGTRALSELQRQFSQPLWVLMALVGMVLFIACANVANLLLVRAIVRRREITIRAALGGGRARIVQQLIVEGVLLSGLGLVAGIVLAYGGVRGLLVFVPTGTLEIEPHGTVLTFSVGLTLLVGMVLGVLPAVQATRIDLRAVLNTESVAVASAGSRFGFRQVLVLVQVAFSVAMLVGAGLFIRTLLALEHADMGIRTEQILQAGLDLGEVGYTPEQLTQLRRRLQERVRALPTVRAAGFMSPALLSGMRGRMDIYPPPYVPKPGEDASSVIQAVSPGTFETMGIAIVKGRDFTERDDDADAPRVIIVNEPMARRFFGYHDPIGRRVGDSGNAQLEIIGVVRETKYYDMREQPPSIVYGPLEQWGLIGGLTLYVRTDGSPIDRVQDVRATVQRIDPRVSLYDVKTFTQQIDDSSGQNASRRRSRHALVASRSLSPGSESTV